MKKVLILFLAVGLVASSCNNKKEKTDKESTTKEKDNYNKDKEENGNKDREETNTGWSSYDKSQWMKVCADPLKEQMGESRATEYCECVLGKIQTRYSTFDKANTMGTEAEGTEMGKECIKELGYQ